MDFTTMQVNIEDVQREAVLLAVSKAEVNQQTFVACRDVTHTRLAGMIRCISRLLHMIQCMLCPVWLWYTV